MPRIIARIVLFLFLLTLVACREEVPAVEWELTIDGDVNQPVTYTFQDLVQLRRAKLVNILTHNPEDPNDRVSWEGVTLFLLFQEPGGVVYSVDWLVSITLADGTRQSINLTKLRGALIAFKDGDGTWLAEAGAAPIKLIAPNQPSSTWLDGPVRITVNAPQ
ncbi:MAG: molybdopterin-dependent oxidoreductase [Candidatus Thorarchaeota archaeon]